MRPQLLLVASLALNLLLGAFLGWRLISGPKSTQKTESVAASQTSASETLAKSLIAEVNPEEGYSISVAFGDLGPKVLESGAIDLSKFQPLNEDYLRILTQGSNEKITIRRDNSHFLLNFFWALGLANKNPLLEEGPIAKYGEGQIGSFASTGGWTLGQKPTMEFYSTTEIIKLTPEQQVRLKEVSDNVFRPCCGNPTSFPDCNHGMALLAVLELLAANNTSVEEMYDAAKYFNAFWFPQQYLDLAVYFKAREGKDFTEVEPKTVVDADHSSAQGWSVVRKWLADNGLVEKAPGGGGSCGVGG